MLFDTLQLSKDLQESFSPQQSETLTRALAQAADDQLATKADISALKSDIAILKSDISTLRAEMATKTDISELKTDTAALEIHMIKEISLLRADTVRWIVTAIAFNFLATAGLIVGLAKFFGK